jgi:ribose/xylose/arabinose/galactoside ABC-type transport system permease subunit
VLKQILKVFFILILAYLVLLHFTGFGKDVLATGSAVAQVTKTLQGRG